MHVYNVHHTLILARPPLTQIIVDPLSHLGTNDYRTEERVLSLKKRVWSDYCRKRSLVNYEIPATVG